MDPKYIRNFAIIALIVLPTGAQQSTPQTNGRVSAASGTAANNTKVGAAPETSASAAKPDERVYQVGGSVKPPIATYVSDVKITKEARKAHVSGEVVVQCIVGTNGKPRDVHVLRGFGMGMDEEAVKAVQQYRFKPAKQNGTPIAVYLNVTVNFQAF